MAAWTRLVPQTLTGRVFALFAGTLVGFLAIASVLFYRYEFGSGIDDALAQAQILSEVVTPTITDSAVIGDYDTVRRILAKAIQHSPFSKASFIVLNGGVVDVTRDTGSATWTPEWLRASVAERLADTNSIINVGGKDYGVLRLRFAPELIAAELWQVTILALKTVALTLLVGLFVISLSLHRWLQPLERIRSFTQGGGTGDSGERALALRGAPIEIREAVDVFARREAEFQVHRLTSAATLKAVGDGVMAVGPHGTIAYANPAAERVLRADGGSLKGRRIMAVLPAVFADQTGPDKLAPWPLRRTELRLGEGMGSVFLETTLASILDPKGIPIGHVLTFRDVTAAHAYECRLRSELETRQSAMRSLGEALRGMLDESDLARHRGADAGLDADLESVSRLVADLVQQREASRRALAEAQQRELRTGREIQRSLLIGDLPGGLAGVELASYNEASRGIDGDFYAITTFRPDCFEVLVGDVMGKGVPAALIGAAVRTTYSGVVTELMATAPAGALPSPADIVNALHRQLTPRLIELDTFVTLALYRFDLARGELRFVNAGHTPGLLRRRDGRIERLLGLNVPVGVTAAERYEEASRPVSRGEALLVYSDGITEARDREGLEFGEERVCATLGEVGAGAVPTTVALQALRRRLQAHVGQGDTGDDETAVLVSLPGPFAADGGKDAEDAPPAEVLELPWNLTQLARLRQRVTALAATAGLDADAASRLELAAFEAATNVLRHSSPPCDGAHLACRLGRRPAGVTVEIWYAGEPFTAPAEALPDFSGESDGGFGLYIIEQCVSRVSYTQPAPGINCTRLEQDVCDENRMTAAA